MTSAPASCPDVSYYLLLNIVLLHPLLLGAEAVLFWDIICCSNQDDVVKFVFSDRSKWISIDFADQDLPTRIRFRIEFAFEP